MPEAWTPALIAVLGACVLLYGFSKTAMPVAGVLAGPLLVAALGATTASGLMVPLLLLGDLFALGYYRQHANWGLIRRLIPGVLLGVVITGILFRLLPISALNRIIGMLILASVALELWRRWDERRKADHEPAPMRSRAGIAFFGALAGMTTMAANAGGTAMTLYLVKMRVPMLAFMGTSAWFFFVVNLLKVPVIVGLGFVTSESLIADLWLAPFIVVGALIGVAVFRRMNERLFTNIALALSAIAAIWLILHG